MKGEIESFLTAGEKKKKNIHTVYVRQMNAVQKSLHQMHEKAEWIFRPITKFPQRPPFHALFPFPKWMTPAPPFFCGKREVGEGGLGENGIGWRRAHSALLHFDSSGRLGGEGGGRAIKDRRGPFPSFYLRRSRHVIKWWELLLLLILGDYFEVMTFKVNQRSRSTFFLCLSSLLISHP